VAQDPENVSGAGHVVLAEAPSSRRLDTHWRAPEDTVCRRFRAGTFFALPR
jgi:hypothetical protein